MVHKPERWAVNAAGVAPEWQWAWRGLVGVVPFWPEGDTWPKHDIPLGSDISELSDPENLGALPAYTLTRLGPAMRTPFDDTVYRGPYFASSEPINVRWRTTSYWTMAVFHQYRAIDSLSVLCGTTTSTVTTAYNGFQRNSAQPSNTVQGYVYVSSANYTTSNVTLTANDFNFTVARYDGSEVWAANYVNGQQTSLATPTSIAGVADHSGSGQRFAFGCGSLNTRQTDTDFLVVYIWDRALGDDEISVLARDPFGPIRPRRLTPADVTPGSDPFRTKVFVP